MCIKLKNLLMRFLRSQREADNHLYIDSFSEITLWMFTFNHSHYAHWLSVHLNDLSRLKSVSRYNAEFVKGHFVTKESSHKFSTSAHDQVYEQLNAMVKGDSSVLGYPKMKQVLGDGW